ncbi:hypothetical protein ANCCEY_00008 [Ancylostoma ceylanicum]|uniref:Rho-GAP domain-containing protein n=1 Tax=Ancylostoma ceylanicum TaxID=53326 RepID=A0A0D6MC10_9BILA|nr:hypothetical protein ANCCEY_00008 [Ancylostoma ceylanicum]
MMIEKRVLDDLVQFQDMEKALTKSRERLNNAFTGEITSNVDIAKKALEKADSTSSNISQLQDTLDAAQLKLENQKVFTALLEEQLEYHRVAMRTLEMVLPEIRRDIDNARPRPVFGVDLTEHLRHTQGRVAIVLEKCCSMLRASGFTEKGLFRVNGNNTKIRRMKAAFDAGQIDIVETLLKHASRLFGCPVVNNGSGGGHQPAGRSLTVDTNSPPKPGQSKDRSVEQHLLKLMPISLEERFEASYLVHDP